MEEVPVNNGDSIYGGPLLHVLGVDNLGRGRDPVLGHHHACRLGSTDAHGHPCLNGAHVRREKNGDVHVRRHHTRDGVTSGVRHHRRDFWKIDDLMGRAFVSSETCLRALSSIQSVALTSVRLLFDYITQNIGQEGPVIRHHLTLNVKN